MAKPYIRPGFFQVEVEADRKRREYDIRNQVLVENEVEVDFVFFGDSITEFWELPAYFSGTGKTIINRGIAGDKSEYMAKRFLGDVVQLHPKHCIFLGGVNDAAELEFNHRYQMPGWTIERCYDRATRNITDIVDQAQANQIDLTVCSVLPTDMVYMNAEAARNEYVLRLNRFLAELCRERGLLFVDYYPHFVCEDAPRLRPGVSFEGIHPNVFGYNIMARVLREALKQRGIEL